MEESKRKKKRAAKEREKFEVGDEEVETRGAEEAKQGNKKRNIDDLENEKTKYKEQKEKRKKNAYRAGNNVEKISEERQENKDEKKEKKKGKDKLIGNNMEENSEIEDKKKSKKKEKYSEKNTEIISDKSQEIEEDYQEKKRKRKKKKEDENVENEETENKKKKMENFNEDLDIFVDKTKKKKSKKSKIKEESKVLSFINDMREGFKNVTVDENGDLDDDTTSKFQEKREEKIRKGDKDPYSSKNEAPGDDKATLKTKKKEKRKKTEIKSAESENSDASDKKNSGDEALLYLKMWKEDRANWAFKKVRQVWLLKHMFDKSKVSKRVKMIFGQFFMRKSTVYF